ncbi:MAG TPA: hypothetical protein VID96_02390, partial [Xanthobacteraceae bacterium]
AGGAARGHDGLRARLHRPAFGAQRRHIVNQIFGPRGRHTRMIYSNNEMPMDCATLVVLYAEIVPDQ